jgi:hypothetical protein
MYQSSVAAKTAQIFEQRLSSSKGTKIPNQRYNSHQARAQTGSTKENHQRTSLLATTHASSSNLLLKNNKSIFTKVT